MTCSTQDTTRVKKPIDFFKIIFGQNNVALISIFFFGKLGLTLSTHDSGLVLD
jgi:hypothetical protein